MDFKDPAIYVSALALVGVIGEGVYFKREIDNLTKIINGLAEENKKRNDRDREILDMIKKYEHNMKIYAQSIDELNSKVKSLSSSLNVLQKEQKAAKKLPGEIPVSKGSSKAKIVEIDSDEESDLEEDDDDEQVKEKVKSLIGKYGR